MIVNRNPMQIKKDGNVIYLADDGTETVKPETVKIGKAKVVGAELLEGVTDSAKKYIEKQATDHEPYQVELIKRENSPDIEVVARGKDGKAISAFTVPGHDSDEEFKSEIHSYVNPPRTGKPEGVEDDAWERRIDAIRDAARDNDEMAEGDAIDFLKARGANLDAVDVGIFVRDVRDQRLDDLIDIIDQGARKKTKDMLKSRRALVLKAPRNWERRVVKSLSPEEQLSVVRRLVHRGWSQENLEQHVLPRFGEQNAEIVSLKLWGQHG